MRSPSKGAVPEAYGFDIRRGRRRTEINLSGKPIKEGRLNVEEDSLTPDIVERSAYFCLTSFINKLTRSSETLPATILGTVPTPSAGEEERHVTALSAAL